MRREGFSGELRWSLQAGRWKRRLRAQRVALVAIGWMGLRLRVGFQSEGTGCCARDAGTGRVAGAGASGGWPCRPRSASTACCFTAIPCNRASIRAVPGDFPSTVRVELHSPSARSGALARSASARAMQLLGAKGGGGTEASATPRLTVAGSWPGAGSGFSPFQMAPRALIHSADIEATGALLPGSRQQWRHISSYGPRDAIARYEAVNPRLSAGQKLVKPDDQGTQVGKIPGQCRRALPSGIPCRCCLAPGYGDKWCLFRRAPDQHGGPCSSSHKWHPVATDGHLLFSPTLVGPLRWAWRAVPCSG